MSRRDNAERRCARCRLHVELCVCALAPRLSTRVTLHVVLSHQEAHKPTNTGALLGLALTNATVQTLSDTDRHVDVPASAALLFPSEAATPIDETLFGGGTGTLVIPDGTWRQARKMQARVAGLSQLKTVTLAAPPPTQYRLRSERHEGGLATYEAAVAALLALGEAPEVGAALLRFFAMFVERSLWARGALPLSEVTHPIPAFCGRPAVSGRLAMASSSTGSPASR